MSSKRVLYKPATKEKVVTKDKRKPLAQGRLVSKSTGGISAPRGKASSLQQGVCSDEGLRTTAAYPRSRSQAKVALSSSPARDRLADDAPRREAPHASMTRSPARAEPMRSLDLSDAESDNLFSPKRHSSKQSADSSVILVDASRQTRGPNTSEVAIELGNAPSPARVICHATSAVHSNLRQTGDIEEGRRITVEQVPTMNVLSYSDYTDPSAPRPTPTFKSPHVVRESSIAGSPMDPHSTARPTISKNLFASNIKETRAAPPPASYPRPRDLSATDNASEASFDSTSDTMSDVSEHTVSQAMSDSMDDPKKRKKASGAHYPTSRYMQSSTMAAKAKSKGPMKATDRTIMGSKSTSGDLKPKRTGNVSKYRVPVLEPKLSGKLKPKKSAGATRTTPQKPGSAQKPGSGKKPAYTTSTPTGVDNLTINQAADASWQHGRYHLTPELSLNMGKRSGKDTSLDFPVRRVVDMSHDSKMSSMSTTTSTIASSTDQDSRTHKPHVELNQLNFDLLYVRYLQWVYLLSQPRKTFREQEKHVMTDLYAMSELVKERRKRKEELEEQLSRLRHVNEVDDALHLQESGLGPVVSGLDQLGQQYRTLATALDTTRHQLPTKGVYMPDNEDQFIDQLQAALNESEQLLGELSVMTRQKQPKVTNFSETLRLMDRTANEEVTELSKCQESLAAATTLTVQECSLLVQDLQLANA